MAQSPEQKSPKPSKLNGGAGGRRRLLDIALILLVSALVGVGAWAIASANESAALSTVVEEPAAAQDESQDAQEGKDADESQDAKKSKDAKEKKSSSKEGEEASSAKDERSPEAGEGDASADDAQAEDGEQTEEDPADEDSLSAAEEGSYEDQPSSEQDYREDYGSSPSPSYDVEDDPAQPYYDPAPSYESEPVQEPTTIVVQVTIDGTPANGSYWNTPVTLDVNATVYDALLASGARINARNTVYGMYVAAIDGLAEKDYGSMSGWVYAVNGVEPPTACSNYRLSDGDSIVWTYVNVER